LENVTRLGSRACKSERHWLMEQFHQVQRWQEMMP